MLTDPTTEQPDDDRFGLLWSGYVPFVGGVKDFSILPSSGGLYRVRVVGTDDLAYVGQSGRGLRSRLLALRLNTLLDECPWNDPHTAAPKLWSFARELGWRYECSAASLDVSDAQRKAVECRLISAYRLARGASPACNFGRLHSDYVTSSNRGQGRRGGRMPESGAGRAPVACAPPLPLLGRWGGRELDWAPLVGRVAAEGFQQIDVADRGGVYNAFDAEHGELLYVGETKHLCDRLTTHCARDWGRPNDAVRVVLPAPTPDDEPAARGGERPDRRPPRDGRPPADLPVRDGHPATGRGRRRRI